MMQNVYSNFTDCYHGLIDLVFNHFEYEVAPRGMRIRESLAVKFKIDNPRDRMPYIASRNFSASYMIAELIWYLTANDETSWISNYSSFWNKISDDGRTANSAYGARIFAPHRTVVPAGIASEDCVQWSFVKNELTRDPDSRRAVIHIRSPHDSFNARLDVPCTLTLQYVIRDGKLHCIVSMRSSDLILGIAYDIPAFTVIQELLALELGVGLGSYTHISNSLHIYERDFEKCEQIIAEYCASFGEMFPLKRDLVSSVYRMLPIEKELRCAMNTSKIIKIVEDSRQQFQPSEHDWIKILASHRASKLCERSLQRALIDSTSFVGYRFFKK